MTYIRRAGGAIARRTRLQAYLSLIHIFAEYLGVSEKTVENRMKAHGGFFVDKNNGGVITKKKSENMVSSSGEEET